MITLTQSLTAALPTGTPVIKNPVQKVFANGDSFQVDRDYTLTNDSTGARLVFDPLAEFNVAVPVLYGTLNFVNGSNQVTSSTITFEASIKPRDWVKPRDPNYSTWYEVLSIDEDNNVLTLRVNFADPSINDDTLIRRISPIGDATVVTVDCFGKTEDGEKTGKFISTGAGVVKDLLTDYLLIKFSK